VKRNFTQSQTSARKPPKTPQAIIPPGNGNGSRLGPVSGPKIEVEVEDRLFRQLKRRLFPQEIEGILFQSQTGDLYWQDQLFSIMVDTWPRLATNLRKLRNAVSSLEYEVKAYSLKGEAPTDTAIEKANFVEASLFGMTSDAAWGHKDFKESIEALVDSWISGFTVLEVDWEARPVIDARLGIVPKCSRWIPGRYFRYPYVLDAIDRLMLNPSGMLGSTALVDFPAFKFLVSVFGSHANFPVFAAPMRVLTSWWIAQRFGLEWFMTFAQLCGIPQRIAYYEPGDDTVYQELVRMMKASAAATWGVYPKGTEISMQTAPGANAAMPQERLLDNADKVCDIMLLGQTLTTDVADSGSRALGDVHRTVLIEVYEAVARYVSKLFSNQIIPGIIQLNYGNRDELPILEPVIEEPVDLVNMANGFNVLFNQMRIPVALQQLYDRLEITPPEEGEELYEPTGGSSSPSSSESSAGGEGGGGAGNMSAEEYLSGGPSEETTAARGTKKKDNSIHRFPDETESAEATAAYFAENADDIAGVDWHSIIDDRTTPVCRQLNGKRWTYPGLKPVGHRTPWPGFPPIFYNCRSHVLPVIRKVTAANPFHDKGGHFTRKGQGVSPKAKTVGSVKKIAPVQAPQKGGPPPKSQQSAGGFAVGRVRGGFVLHKGGQTIWGKKTEHGYTPFTTMGEVVRFTKRVAAAPQAPAKGKPKEGSEAKVPPTKVGRKTKPGRMTDPAKIIEAANSLHKAVNEKYEQARQEYLKANEAWQTGGFERSEELYKKVKETNDAHNAAYNELANAGQNFKDLISIHHSEHGEFEFQPETHYDQPSAKAVDRIIEAGDFVQSMVPERHIATLGTVNLHMEHGHGRATANPYDKRINMYQDSEVHSYVHELGHVLEYGNNWHGANKAFQDKRNAGSKQLLLRDHFNDPRYGDETSYEDEWEKRGNSVYAGKNYPDGQTEIMSMGLQRMYQNPMKFAVEDPEYFTHVFNLIRSK